MSQQLARTSNGILMTGEDAEEEVLLVDLKKIKKDALYKPLLRKFRNFLRKHMESFGLLK